MKKLKILWFCGAQFSDKEIKTTGTWLIAMGEAIANMPELELYNVTYGDVKTITQENFGNITQWVIPYKETINHVQSSNELKAFIKKLNDDLLPDLIHVWGSEVGFGYTLMELNLRTPILLDIQGLLFVIVKDYYGGLSKKNLFKIIGIKELLRPRNHPYFIRRTFKKRGENELILISKLKNISVQSDWVNSIIKNVNPKCNIYQTGIMLRSEFYKAQIWNHQKNSDIINIFTSCSGPIPYKGLHIIFEAIALLKNKYPNIKLNIGGDIQIMKKYGCIRDGFTSWMLKRAAHLGIQDSISWLGKMNANEMINEMHRSTMVVIPSYVETYSLFLAESMMVGVPSVVSFAGAMPQLAIHNKSALFFPVGDYWSCSQQIERIINEPELSRKLSLEARNTALQRNDKANVIQTQLDIYNNIINKDVLEMV